MCCGRSRPRLGSVGNPGISASQCPLDTLAKRVYSELKYVRTYLKPFYTNFLNWLARAMVTNMVRTIKYIPGQFNIIKFRNDDNPPHIDPINRERRITAVK